MYSILKALSLIHILGLWLEGQKYFGQSLPGGVAERDDLPLFDAVTGWLDRYFAGDRPQIAGLPLRPNGSAFRQSVWKLLCEIPYGEVTTYGEIAKRIAAQLGRETMSGQAVGGAVGHNPCLLYTSAFRGPAAFHRLPACAPQKK